VSANIRAARVTSLQLQIYAEAAAIARDYETAANVYLMAATRATNTKSEQLCLENAWINFERMAGRRSELEAPPHV
jgi:hypothetical protein